MTTDQDIKNKTFASDIDTARYAVGTWWIDMSHFARVFSCNFTFIFNLQMYKKYIIGEFICS